jgi:hypothetical protein
MSKPGPIPGTSKHSRFTTLTCLFCALPVYRVHHIISLDVEGNTTTFLPSEEWVETDILKSGTGWIDVHADCLVCGAFCISTFNNMKGRYCSAIPKGRAIHLFHLAQRFFQNHWLISLCLDKRRCCRGPLSTLLRIAFWNYFVWNPFFSAVTGIK